MRVALHVTMLVAVFAGVGWLASWVVMSHAAVGTPAPQVRLAAWMAGLFAGGFAVVVVGVAMLRRR